MFELNIKSRFSTKKLAYLKYAKVIRLTNIPIINIFLLLSFLGIFLFNNIPIL